MHLRYEGHEGNEEGHEAQGHEGRRGGCTCHEGHEGHEGDEESHESHEGHEGHESHEEVSGWKCCSVLVLGNGSRCLASGRGGVPRLARLYIESFASGSKKK